MVYLDTLRICLCVRVRCGYSGSMEGEMQLDSWICTKAVKASAQPRLIA